MTLEIETSLEAGSQLMERLKAAKKKYDEAYKSFKDVEGIIERTLGEFDSWGFRDDTFQPFWMRLDRENALYENTFRDKNGKVHTVRITKDGRLTIGQLAFPSKNS